MEKVSVNKVVLAYSGGLDTSVIVSWLRENYHCEVICFTADIGQGEETADLPARAKASGASKLIQYDLREEFASEHLWPLVRSGAIYERKYLLGTSVARPLIAKYQVKVAEEEVTRYDAHLKDAAARLKAGVVTRNEVLQAEVTLADSQQRLLTAENNQALRASRVNSLLLRPLTEDVHPQEIVGTPVQVMTLEEAWSSAEAQNPDLRDLEARIHAKEENVSFLRGEYLPQIYVSGGYEYNENQYMVNQDNWSVIAGVSMSLFAGGSTGAKVGAAKSEVLSLRMSREKLLDAVRMSAQAAWLEVQSSQKKIQVALAAVGQAQRARGGAGGDDEGPGQVGTVLRPDAERALREVDGGDGFRRVLRAEPLGLFPHPFDELRPLDPVGEPGEVLDIGGEGELPARLPALQDEGRQVGPGGVDGGGGPRAAGAEDDHVANHGWNSSRSGRVPVTWKCAPHVPGMSRKAGMDSRRALCENRGLRDHSLTTVPRRRERCPARNRPPSCSTC
mgnify:CR=1 FL=1